MYDNQLIKPALRSYCHTSKYSVEVRRSITHCVEIWTTVRKSWFNIYKLNKVFCCPKTLYDAILHGQCSSWVLDSIWWSYSYFNIISVLSPWRRIGTPNILRYSSSWHAYWSIEVYDEVLQDYWCWYLTLSNRLGYHHEGWTWYQIFIDIRFRRTYIGLYWLILVCWMVIDVDDTLCWTIWLQVGGIDVSRMEYEAISIQNSSLDAYKLISDDTKCVGWLWNVVVTCWISC